MKSTIPTHQLDTEDHRLKFDMLVWGKKENNYDIETPHRHDYNEVLIFFEGGGTHEIDFTTYAAKGKSIHFVGSDNVHLVLRDKASAGCSLLFANEYFNEDLLARLPFSKTNPILDLNPADFVMISKLVETIKTEYFGKQPGYEAITRAYMQALMLHLVRIYQASHPGTEEKYKKPEAITRFLQLVQQQYKAHMRVEQYAALLNISAKHLIELCKLHTGKTPLQHIRERVISEAKKLLFHTSLSVKEIAYELNFDDPANFSKYFKSATHYTPLEYREGIR